MTTEGQLRNFYPAFRVFVFGVEITDDVLSVGVTHADGRSPSTAEIVLANKDGTLGIDDRYIITEADIKAMTHFDPTKVVLPDDTPVIAGIAEKIRSIVDQSQNAALVTELFGGAFDLEAQLQGQFGVLKQAQLDQNQAILDATEAVYNDAQKRVLASIQAAVMDPLKQEVLAAKAPITTRVGNPDARTAGESTIATIQQFDALRGLARRYPYQVGDCIFHSQDPVRIFFRDPRDPTIWYHMFAGFITDWVDDVDANNTKTVTLRCEDVLRALRYARFTTSPGLIDIDAASTNIDLVIQNFNDDDFRNLTLPDFLFTMVFGAVTSGTDRILQDLGRDTKSLSGTTTVQIVSPKGTTQANLNKDGVGLFSAERSSVFIFGPADDNDFGAPTSVTQSLTVLNKQVRLPVGGLPLYQSVIDHQVRTTDLKSMALTTATPITIDTVDPITRLTRLDDVIKAIGEHPEIYPVDGGRLVMLVPSTLGVGYTKDILFQGFKGPELTTTFSTRLQKIYDVLERAEFSFYANGRGDLIAEMPLHDFVPDDFGTDVVTSQELAAVLGQQQAQTILDPNHPAGPFAPYYHVAAQDTIKWSRTFSDEKVKTLATCTWYNIEGLKETAFGVDTGSKPARQLIQVLVPQFGIRYEPAEPTILVGDERAAEIYCQLLLNRNNGDARQVAAEVIPQLRLMPNRPLLFTERAFVGTVREVAHHITWGEKGDMTMSLKLNYIRGWDGNFEEDGKTPVYSYLGGMRANWLNYALLFRKTNPPSTTKPLAIPDLDLTFGGLV